MLRKALFLSLATLLVPLLTSAKAQGWGGFHAGYTHVGPGGVSHYGRTAGVGPYGGGYSGAHYGAYGAYGGAYRGGWGYGDRYGGAYYRGYHYAPSYYGRYYGGG